MKRLRILVILVLVPLLFGCSKERGDVQAYLDQVVQELPVIKSVGKETERAFDDLRFGPKTRDLNVLQQRVESARAGVEAQIEKLTESRDRLKALVPPPAAAKLSVKLLQSYDAWLECGQEVKTLCGDAETAISDLKSGPQKGKWKRFGEAAQQFGDRSRALGKKARDAADLSEEVGREVKKLQRKYKVHLKDPEMD